MHGIRKILLAKAAVDTSAYFRGVTRYGHGQCRMFVSISGFDNFLIRIYTYVF